MHLETERLRGLLDKAIRETQEEKRKSIEKEDRDKNETNSKFQVFCDYSFPEKKPRK